MIKQKTVLYRKFVDNYKGDYKQRLTAIEAAKEYIKKYADDAGDKEIIEYFKKTIPLLERTVVIEKQID